MGAPRVGVAIIRRRMKPVSTLKEQPVLDMTLYSNGVLPISRTTHQSYKEALLYAKIRGASYYEILDRVAAPSVVAFGTFDDVYTELERRKNSD